MSILSSRRRKLLSRLHIVVFVLLTICKQCFAQNQEEERFYQLYPDLIAHKEIVETAYEQLKRSGFKAKTPAWANRAVALRAYVLLNQSTGAKMPYRQVLEEYNRVLSDFPELKDLGSSLPEFASDLNKNTGSTAFDEGLNDNWLRRAGVSIHRWGIVTLLAALGLIFLVTVWGRQAALPVRGESVWQRAMRPAGTAAKWGSILGMLAVFRSHQNLSLVEHIGFALAFSLTLALLMALPVYLIAAFSYAMGGVENQSSCDEQIEIPRMGIEAQA